MYNEDIATLLAPLITPLIQDATIVEPQRVAAVGHGAGSRFGGRPYAEAGDSWLVCGACGRPLTFICQIRMADCAHHPIPGIGLFTFYYCWECFPQEGGAETAGQWIVRLYGDPQEGKAVSIEPPQPGAPVQTIPCGVTMQPTRSLPDWDGIAVWCPEAADLSAQADADEPWQPYLSTAEQLVGEADYATMVGGYPHWVQSDATPICPGCGQRMELLAQIDSERAAGITWGDAGLVYLFVCPEHLSEIRFEMQSF
jgi:hypothetical protein